MEVFQLFQQGTADILVLGENERCHHPDRFAATFTIVFYLKGILTSVPRIWFSLKFAYK